MFSEAKVTEIYCLADDFCKEFAKYQEKHIWRQIQIVLILSLVGTGGPAPCRWALPDR